MRVLIVAASCRPAVQSLVQAGHVPVAFDLFCDWDSELWVGQSNARLPDQSPLEGQVNAILGYQALADALITNRSKLIEADAAMLLGGSELCEPLVEAIFRRIPMVGTCPKSLQQFSSMSRVLGTLRGLGVAIPETTRNRPQDVAAMGWLSKAESACGGRHVIPVPRDETQIKIQHRPGKRYWQQRVSGPVMGVQFLTDVLGRTEWVGATRQFCGCTALGATEFEYCGSIGPLHLEPEVRQMFRSLGQTMGDALSIQGLWGADVIWPHPNGRPILLDVNPRPTAAVELFELALLSGGDPPAKSMLDLHLMACLEARSMQAFPLATEARLLESKAIVFQSRPEPLRIDEASFQCLQEHFDASFFFSRQTGFSVADIPQLGTVIEPGDPILTMRGRFEAGRGDSDDFVDRCWRSTIEKADALRRRL